MNDLRPRPWVIPASLLLALMLTIVPLPEWGQRLRPEWVVMVLVYWSMALPRRVGVGIGWLLGLLVDVLQGTLLGQNALGCAIAAYLAIRFHQRIRVHPLWQQAVSVALIVFPYMLVNLWVQGIVGRAPGSWWYWAPLFTSALLWPPTFIVLRALRRHARLA